MARVPGRRRSNLREQTATQSGKQALASSAQRTFENSPAIYRWEANANSSFQSARRTTQASECIRLNCQLQSPASRAQVDLIRRAPSTEVLGYFRAVRFADAVS